MQSAGDARRAIGNLGMAAPARAAGDAEEEVGCFHSRFSDLLSGLIHSVIPGWCASTRPGISSFSGAQLRAIVRCCRIAPE
jgi:hypothetical protein